MRLALGLFLVMVLAGCGDSSSMAGFVDAGRGSDDGGFDGGPRDDAASPEDASSDAQLPRDAGVDATAADAGALDAGVAPDCGFSSARDELYLDAAGLTGSALVAALHAQVSASANGLGYDAARELMYGITGSIDVNEANEVTCAYTGARVQADGTRSPGAGDAMITTEHSWPRSDGAERFPAEGDLHHLFPAVAPANGARGSHEFGDVACSGSGGVCGWSDGGSFLGPAADGREEVFEVRPAMRGDVARAHFYFAVRYERTIPSDEEVTLRGWHCQDPPSAEERARNDRIEAHQRNRNPFVDQPALVARIIDF